MAAKNKGPQVKITRGKYKDQFGYVRDARWPVKEWMPGLPWLISVYDKNSMLEFVVLQRASFVLVQ